MQAHLASTSLLTCHFRLSNAGASFCCLMEMCLGDQQYLTLLFYLDNTCIFSSSVNEMLNRIEMVLECISKTSILKLSREKSFFFQSKVLFLGHILSKKGISPNPNKIQKVKDWPVPTNTKEVHSFLGLASYYRQFVLQFAKWANSLHNLIHALSQRRKVNIGLGYPLYNLTSHRLNGPNFTRDLLRS